MQHSWGQGHQMWHTEEYFQCITFALKNSIFFWFNFQKNYCIVKKKTPRNVRIWWSFKKQTKKTRKLRFLKVPLVHQKKAFIHSVSFVLVPFLYYLAMIDSSVYLNHAFSLFLASVSFDLNHHLIVHHLWSFYLSHKGPVYLISSRVLSLPALPPGYPSSRVQRGPGFTGKL